LIGFYKVGSGKPGITYKEALDEALCFGWIDGIRKRIDELSYQMRFTPRKPGSIWSAVNIKRVGELKALGRMLPSGLETFEKRDPKKEKLYSFEVAPRQLDPADEKLFKANEPAWAYFQAQAPSYQRAAKHWVTSAKKDETRVKRLATLIDCSERGVWLPQYRWSASGRKNSAPPPDAAAATSPRRKARAGSGPARRS
jgi:uncharacterized protein YdeI (YjbR/CyaY-like superfamily)